MFLNPGKLVTEMEFEILSESLDSSFTIKETNLLIPACEQRTLTIQFHPQMTGVREVALQGRIKGNDEVVFSCDLVGEGILPSVLVEVSRSLKTTWSICNSDMYSGFDNQ